MDPTGQSIAENLTTSDISIAAARDVVGALHLVLKNRGIYPVDHTICKRSTESFAQVLFSFLSNFGCLKFDVNRDALLFGGEIIYQSQGDARDLPFILFRDGIQWIEFQEGFQVTFLPQFLEILDKFRELPPEAEEDLVTALWEANLPNLHYKAVEVYWQGEPILDMSSLSLRGDDEVPVAASEAAPVNQMALIAQTESHSLYQLTEEEMAGLKELMRKDERRDPVPDLIDILSVFLVDQSRSHGLGTVLEFLVDEIHDILQSGEVSAAYTLLRHLHDVRDTLGSEKPWVESFIDEFFDRLAQVDTLKSAAGMWLSPALADDQRLEASRAFWALFSSKAFLVLGPVLPQVRLPKVQECLMGILETWAQNDIAPLETLLADSEPAVIERLVIILGHLQGARAKEILSDMVYHKAEPVRRQALRQLLAQDPDRAFDLFYLIEDPRDTVRQVILASLGQARNPKLEKRLLNYLQKQDFKIDTDEHLLACYRVLGRCGSNHSLAFLNRQLLDQGWLSTRLKSLQRRGALIALSNIGTDEANDLVQKAAKSLKPSIRSAYRKVMEKTK